MAATLKDRVRAAVIPAAPAPVVEEVQGATAQELHAAQQAGGGEAADVVMSWLEYYRGEITAALPECVEVGGFLSAVRAALPKLSRCTPASLFQAVMTCARFGLIPDGQQAVIKAEGVLAVFVPMYRGYVELMYRSGRVNSVHVEEVYAADEFSWEPTMPAPLDLVHKPRKDLPKAERGEVVMVYAFAWMANGARSAAVVLNREDAEEIRDEYSEAYRRAEADGTRSSFWHTHFVQMWVKSALRRLAKLVPTSAELRLLTMAEDAGDARTAQILHAPAPEVAGPAARAEGAAEADAAHEAAEAGQDPEPGPVPVGTVVKGRRPHRPKRQRGGTRGGRRAAA